MKKTSIIPIAIAFFLLSNLYGGQWVRLTKNSDMEKAPRVKILSQSPSEMILEVNIFGFSKEKLLSGKETFDKIDFENAARLTEAGVPDIPYVSKVLAIKNTGNPVAKVIETGRTVKLKNYNLPPVRESWIEGMDEPEYSKSKNVYGNDSFFPTTDAKFDKPAIFRDFRIARLSVFPFKYNPVTKQLEVITSLKIKITYDSKESINEKNDLRNIAISPTFDRLYRSVIFNYDEALALSGKTVKGGKDLMLCIMQDVFYDSFQRYAEWKRKTGIDVHVTKFSEIGATANTPEVVKEYIRSAYETWETPPTHVLIVGDEGIAPVKYVSYDFTFLNEDYFVELEGDDFIPEMLIGRFTNQGDYRMRVMIDKFIKYEQLHAGDDPEWFTRAAVCSNNYYDSQVKTKRFTARVLREDGGFTQVDTLMSKTGCPYDLEDVKNAINAGISFLNYRGEGWNDGWHANCYTFTPSDVASLHNEMKLPFVTSIGCGVAMFDAEDGNCFGETWVQLGAFDYQRGAVAFVGPTSNTHTTYNNRIDKGIYVGMFREGMEQPAEALLRGKFYMYNVFGPTHWVEYHFRIYTTLGDPSVHIWKGTPVEISLDKPDELVVGFNQIRFKVSDGRRIPVSDAQVILYNDNLYKTVYTDENGYAFFNVTMEEPGKVYVTVRGSDVAFYEDSLRVSYANESVGIYGEPYIDDSDGGNADGLVEPNENFELYCKLKNWGTETAENVTAELIVPDSIDFVGIANEDPVSFGNIDAGDTTSSQKFSVFTLPNAVIDSTVQLVLKINSSENSWNYIYKLKISGCKLRYGNYVVDDSGATHENYKLDPGETAKVYFEIVNLGKDTARGVIGNLRSLDEYISVVDSQGFWGDIKPKERRTNNGNFNTFKVEVAPDCPRNYRALMQLELKTSEGFYSYSTIRTFYIDVAMPTSADPTGPDDYGYYAYDIDDKNYTEAPVFDWVEISDVGTEIDYTSSDYWTTIDLPFDVRFYGNTFNQITISTDGWAALGNPDVPANEWRNQTIPTEDGLNNLLSVFWDDYISEGMSNGRIYYYYNEHRKTFVVEWKDVDHFGDPAAKETFEIIIYDPNRYSTQTGDSEILFQYHNCEESGHGTIGIENDAENDGIQFSYNGERDATSAEVQDDFAIKFTTDPPVLIVGVDEEESVANKFELFQNYPNPFNPTTTIKYAIPELRGKGSAKVKLIVYDILGRKVATLVNKEQQAGIYEVRFNASDMSSGIYFYRLSYGGFVGVKKMILLK